MYRVHGRLSRSLGTVASVFVFLLSAAVAQAQEVKLIRGPYVQMPASDSIVIAWRTAGKIAPVVKFGRQPDRLDHAVEAAAISVNDKLQKGVGGFSAGDVLDAGAVQYEARLTGLEPATTYYYAVYSGEKLLAGGDESFHFRTNPPIGDVAPCRFAAFGDPHGPGWLKTGIENTLKEFCAKEKRPVDFYVSLGDYTSKGRNMEFDWLFGPIDPVRRSLPCWATRGNHDIVRHEGSAIIGPYADAFVMPMKGESGGEPSGTKAWYSFNYGRVHFVSLDSFGDCSAEGAMARWLKADLARAKAEGKSDWIIAFFHAPLMTRPGPANMSHRDAEEVEGRAFLLPILEEGGVDLMLSGHVHIYERTMLVDGLYMTPIVAPGHIFNSGDGDPKGDGPYRKSAGLHAREGEVAVIVGTGGGPGMEGSHPVGKRAFLNGGMLVVDVAGDTLTARTMDYKGAVRDTFQVIKRGQVTPKAVPPPATPLGWYYRRKLDGTRFALVPLLDKPAALDGKLDDEAWKSALKVRLREGNPVDARLFGAPDALYVGVSYCTGGQLKTRETQRDGPLLALDPTVEVYLAPGSGGKDFYEFSVSCAGVKRDAKNEDTSYNPDWVARTSPVADGRGETFIAEMRIPWQAIGLKGPPAESELLGINVVGTRVGTGAEWFTGRSDLRFISRQTPIQFGYARFGTGRALSLIPPYDPGWKYLAGQDPATDWTRPEFNVAVWKTGAPGFGYGDIDNTTRLLDMKGAYSRVYARKTFEVKDPKSLRDLMLMLTYDDAFIAYLNGTEVLRVGVGQGRGAEAKNIAVHEGGGPEYPADQVINRMTPLEGVPLAPEYFALTKHLGLLREGTNVLAIEGHNASLNSKAFTLDPHLLAIRRE